MRKIWKPADIIEKLRGRLEKARRLVLFLDYDGTLRPIAPRPQDALPGAALLALLRRLEQTNRMTVAIVTGRPVRNIRRFLPLQHTWFVGTHGVEWCHGIGTPRRLIDTRGAETAIQKIIKKLEPKLNASFTLEKKGFSLSLHHRLAEPARRRDIFKVLRKWVSPYVSNQILKLTWSKGAVEAAPFAANKGLAVDAVLQGRSDEETFCLAMGDDRIDEALFRKMDTVGGVGIVVGDRPSMARMRLGAPRDTQDFLRRLQKIWAQKIGQDSA